MVIVVLKERRSTAMEELSQEYVLNIVFRNSIDKEELLLKKYEEYYRVINQVSYNENLVNVRNPEVRHVFTQLRDDEMRDIARIQQKIERNKGSSGIIAKIIPKKTKY